MSQADKLADFAVQNDISPVELVTLAQELRNKYLQEKINAINEDNKKYVGRYYKNTYEDGSVEYIKIVSHLSETDGWVTGLSFMRDVKIDVEYGYSGSVWFSFTDIYINAYAPTFFEKATEISEAEYTKEANNYIGRLLDADWEKIRVETRFSE